MVHRIRIARFARKLSFAIIPAVTIGCFGGTDKNSDLKDVAAQLGGHAEDRPLPLISGNGTESESPKATLAQGKKTAFGITIPRGMVPAPGPHRVFRFEGSYPVVQVKDFIGAQVTAKEIAAEGSGYLMRQATLRKSTGRVGSDKPMAIRVFKGRKRGATIDVWFEHEYKKSLPELGAVHELLNRQSPPPSKTMKEDHKKRSETMQEILTSMQKGLRGERPDPKLEDSPGFN